MMIDINDSTSLCIWVHDDYNKIQRYKLFEKKNLRIGLADERQISNKALRDIFVFWYILPVILIKQFKTKSLPTNHK